MSKLSLPLLWVCLLSLKRDLTEHWEGAWRAPFYLQSEKPNQASMLCSALVCGNRGEPRLTGCRDETRSPQKGKWFWCGLRLREGRYPFTELSVTVWCFTCLVLGWFCVSVSLSTLSTAFYNCFDIGLQLATIFVIYLYAQLIIWYIHLKIPK